MKLLIKRLLNTIIIILCFPLSLIIVLLGRYYLIRFGCLFGEKIGHLSADTEAYLLQKKYQNIKSLDLLTVTKNISNIDLLNLWKKKLIIFKNRQIIMAFEFCCRVISRSDRHSVKLFANFEYYYLFNNFNCSISFDNKDYKILEKFLKKNNFRLNQRFICIHNRDNLYHEKNLQELDLNYHSHRNFEIFNMAKATEFMIKLDYKIIRMGKEVEQKLDSKSSIIDYSNSSRRNTLLDLLLISKCNFYVGSDSGLWGVALLFRKPIIWTNMTSIKNLQIVNYAPLVFIFKHFYSNELNKYLSLAELNDKNLLNLNNVNQLKENNIDLIENSKDEIEDVIKEMYLIENNTINYSKEDDDLQNKFWNKINKLLPLPNERAKNFRIGTKFLKQNLYLIN